MYSKKFDTWICKCHYVLVITGNSPVTQYMYTFSDKDDSILPSSPFILPCPPLCGGDTREWSVNSSSPK